MAKKVTAKVKLQLPAGKATTAPPVGPALAPHGINMMEFIKAYNAQTAPQAGSTVPVEVTIYEDRTFTFILKTPPASELLIKAAGLPKGASAPGKDKPLTVTRAHIRQVAEAKMPDLNANDIEAAMHIIEGQARSMGCIVVD
ncbi:MAG TPA: 50S ribosomal protein L11 [Armatimonadota bacterium]|nr:50S ribosomal protein L11 [Armatimonadota bacterium]